jgi:hypothetical protein
MLMQFHVTYAFLQKLLKVKTSFTIFSATCRPEILSRADLPIIFRVNWTLVITVTYLIEQAF